MRLSVETTLTMIGNLGVGAIIVLDGELAEVVEVSVLVSGVKPFKKFVR